MKVLKHLLVAGVFFAAVTSLAAKNDIHGQIVGGVEATPGEFPYIVSLQDGGGHFCGGSLIKKNWVLTAAHCVVGSSLRSVVVGAHDFKKPNGSETLKVKQVIQHPDYDDNNSDFDFALIELAEESQFVPVTLNTEEIAIPSGQTDMIMATVAGWGVTKEHSSKLPTKLRKVDVPLVSVDECNKSYDNGITDRMICAGFAKGGKDSCQGDSGGPLIVKALTGEVYLAGVVSFGDGCARKNKPGVYSKVSSVATWIEQTTR